MEKVIIFSLQNGGLFMSRQIRRKYPHAVIYGIGYKEDIGQYSNTIDAFYPILSKDDLFKTTQQAYSDLGKGTVYGYLCNNMMLEWVVLCYPEVFGFITFENSLDTYKAIVDKKNSEELCAKYQITIPIDYKLTPDLDYNSIHYPVVVKPTTKMDTKGASKCKIINDSVSLQTYLKSVVGHNVPLSSLSCQQFINGSNRWEYGYGGFYVDGVPTIEIFFHQFRQYPQGLCCYIREMTDSDLKRKIKDLVKSFPLGLRFNGFLEFDIKQDSNTKELYLLDINPRPWRSSDMLMVKLGQSNIYDPVVSNINVEWTIPFDNLLCRLNKKNSTMKECIALTGKSNFVTIHPLEDVNDPIPYQKQKRVEFDRIIKKLLKLVHIKK